MYTVCLCPGDDHSCPPRCTCDHAGPGVHVDCRDDRLSSVPRPLPTHTYHLRVTGTKISAILHDDFTGCNKLKVLELSDNVIHTIDKEAFKNMSQLTHLYLDDNKLILDSQTAKVPNGTLDDLTNIEQLKINNNQWQLADGYRYDIIKNKRSAQEAFPGCSAR